MNYSIFNILDLLDVVGVDKVSSTIETFSTKRSESEDSLNPDIEKFLKNNAIQFAREKKSVTYFVVDEENPELYGFFTIAQKSIEIPREGLSKTKIRVIERFAQYHEDLQAYVVAAYLIAQFSKNYSIPKDRQITGNHLMEFVFKELYDVRHRIGGGIVYLDCEADVNLINFYEKEGFRLFGERISEKDKKRYLQYMKFF